MRSSESAQLNRNTPCTSAFRNLLILISKHEPENSAEYLEFLYLYGNHWTAPQPPDTTLNTTTAASSSRCTVQNRVMHSYGGAFCSAGNARIRDQFETACRSRLDPTLHFIVLDYGREPHWCLGACNRIHITHVWNNSTV